MVLLIILAVISMICAIYGAHSFNGKYTCKWMYFDGLKKWCMRFSWIPSGSIIVLVLSIAIFRGLLGGGMMM